MPLNAEYLPLSGGRDARLATSDTVVLNRSGKTTSTKEEESGEEEEGRWEGGSRRMAGSGGSMTTAAAAAAAAAALPTAALISRSVLKGEGACTFETKVCGSKISLKRAERVEQASAMCRTCRPKTLSRTCVVDLNLARRPRPTRTRA